MTWIIALSLALSYTARLSRMDRRTHDWVCIAAQVGGGLAGCLLALAALHGSDPEWIWACLALLGTHLGVTHFSGSGMIAGTGVPTND